ncbi:MAG: hypothetical protein ACI8Y4_003309 [Candidatus Poriferisodalaceae bacterium]|jgi:hypothetical protein
MLLSPYRVLDLSDERGQLAGMMLADLGAEVILVEPPGGSRSRRRGPFHDGRVDDPEASLWFWSYNRGKRSVTLDLDNPADQERLRALAATADIVIESDDPGVMAARGLGAVELLAANPTLIYTSVTAFGQLGPKASWAATDMIVAAAGMEMRIQATAIELRYAFRWSKPFCMLPATVQRRLSSRSMNETGPAVVNMSTSALTKQLRQRPNRCRCRTATTAPNQHGRVAASPLGRSRFVCGRQR